MSGTDYRKHLPNYLLTRWRDQAISLKVWHSLRSDLSQREMLKVAAEHRILRVAPENSVWQEVIWLANETTKLSGRRNNAIHVPFVFVNHAVQVEVLPFYFLGNPKAETLASKKPLEEFKWYRANLAILADYASTPHYGIAFFGKYKLPRRPTLPTLGQKANSKRPARKNKTKQSRPLRP